MMLRFILTGLLFAACQTNTGNHMTKFMPDQDSFWGNPYEKVKDIPPPPGFTRMIDSSGSFTHWLRNAKLKKDKTVFLYNGKRKQNQLAQFAVLDIPIGKKDLQQCADAVMRLRAQYLLDNKRYNEIVFADNAGTCYRYKGLPDSLQFERYLEKVFAWCGTQSLVKQLRPVAPMDSLLPGDVLIKGGSPGHAVIIMDVAVNAKGRKAYMLAQGYMPAQDMHLLVNPVLKGQTPWYLVSENEPVTTPEWVFDAKSLMRW